MWSQSQCTGLLSHVITISVYWSVDSHVITISVYWSVELCDHNLSVLVCWQSCNHSLSVVVCWPHNHSHSPLYKPSHNVVISSPRETTRAVTRSELIHPPFYMQPDPHQSHSPHATQTVSMPCTQLSTPPAPRLSLRCCRGQHLRGPAKESETITSMRRGHGWHLSWSQIPQGVSLMVPSPQLLNLLFIKSNDKTWY